MDEELKMNEILDNIKFMEKLYDIIRIVDPVNKTVLSYKDNDIQVTDSICYDFWNQNNFCKNCISVRAYTQKETYIKVEYNGTKVYMITAVPIDVESRTVILELLKDITGQGIVQYLNGKSTDEIYSVLNRENETVVKDPLTNVYNKRFINEALPYEIVTSLLQNKYASIIMVDIDHFKKVNDTYGHLCGDFVLKEFANILSNSIRKDDGFVSRFGGEEFLVFLKSNDEDTAPQIAERMRTKLENTIINYKDLNIKITASFGIHTIHKQISLDTFIEYADKNLYTAKNSGRNRVVSNSL